MVLCLMKTYSVSMQTSSHGWYESSKGHLNQHRGDPSQVVIESMIFENSSLWVEMEEMVLMPQPAKAQGGPSGQKEGSNWDRTSPGREAMSGSPNRSDGRWDNGDV